ncbi:MAG: exo-alpha-sialidase [Rhizobiales bacterium]|nr:exo-alpha-sialidase [Hyphomicrobiales bacterium]MBI3674765.1 exo-alpha-sialidase [Hyphomicrobiales bacterium]
MRISQFLFCTLATFGSIAGASAETLKNLASQTHYHGIAFVKSGSAELLLATHQGLFAVSRSGEATRVSPVHDFMGFSPDPANPLVYFASGHPAEGGNSGFLRSADGGATWSQLSTGLNGPVDFHQMTVSPADATTIYGAYGSIQVSHDGGQSWAEEGPAPVGLIAIAASPVDRNRLYAATKSGLMLSSDGGNGWTTFAFDGETVATVAAGGDGTLMAFVLGRGLMRGKDGAAGDWSPLSNDFGDSIPLHIALDPANRQHMALTTQKNEVLESSDGGATWAPFAGQ